MDTTILIAIIMEIIFSVIILWKTTLIMIEKKKIPSFAPFFIVGVAFCFYASFIFYEIYETTFWMFYELLLLTSVIWILMILRGRKNGFN